jgi:hypothetical protein
MWRFALLTHLARIGSSLGAIDLATRSVEEVADQATTSWATHSLATAKAVLAEARQELESAEELYDEAARGWRDLGVLLEWGLALLGLGRCRIRLARLDEGGSALTDAREAFVGLGARDLVTESDALLEEARARAS